MLTVWWGNWTQGVAARLELLCPAKEGCLKTKSNKSTQNLCHNACWKILAGHTSSTRKPTITGCVW